MIPAHTVIAIAGPKTVGKSFTAESIQDYLFTQGATSCEIDSLARPIKDGIAAMGFASALDNKEAKVYLDHTLRDLYVSLGQQWGRETVGRDVWLDLLCKRIDACSSRIVIVDDVRMQNEYARLTAAYGAETFVLQRQGIRYTMENPTEQGIVGGTRVATDDFDMPRIVISILYAAGICDSNGEVFQDYLPNY